MLRRCKPGSTRYQEVWDRLTKLENDACAMESKVRMALAITATGKAELTQFLKDNLRISVSVDERGSSYGHGGGLSVKVKLLLEDEVISEADDYCSSVSMG